MSFVDAASEAIKASGGRMTAQRRLLLELLAQADGQLDAERLYHLAYEHDTSISLATVYRTLNTLEDAGLLQQRYLSREHDRKVYEPAISDGHPEYHFTCRGCHRVIPFQSDIVNRLREELQAELGVAVLNMCVCFDGLCANCQAAQTTESRGE